MSRTVGRTYRDQVYVTPSGMLNLPHFLFYWAVPGVDRMLFSVDYLFLTMTGAQARMESLPVDHTDCAAFAHGNAERFLRLQGKY